MTKKIRTQVVLALAVALGGTLSFAQAGEAVYRANCQSCHGPTGTPNPGIAKMLGVNVAGDYNKSSEADMIAAVKNGKGKMKSFGGKLTDAQIKDAVAYFRSFK